MGGAGAEAELYEGGSDGALFGGPQAPKAIFMGQALHYIFGCFGIAARIALGQAINRRDKPLDGGKAAIPLKGRALRSIGLAGGVLLRALRRGCADTVQNLYIPNALTSCAPRYFRSIYEL